LFPKKVEI
jgi:Ca2+-binding EF-hand superfamily protein